MINGLLFWLILLAVFYLAYTLGARNAAARFAAERAAPPVLPPERLDAPAGGGCAPGPHSRVLLRQRHIAGPADPEIQPGTGF